MGTVVATAGEGLFFGGFVLLWLAFLAFIIGGTVLWILALIEVVKIPEHQFRATSTEKTTWLLIVVLAGQIGALIWWFGPRKRVKALDGMAPPPWMAPVPPGATPAGWYPDPGAGNQLRWWDGHRWGPLQEQSPTAPPPPPGSDA